MDEENRTTGPKVYSPDLQTFSLEGRSGIFGTIASIVVGPIRLLSRVSHNIMILPAGLLGSYAEGLLFVGVVVTLLGVVDLVFFRKWPLLVSQLPVLLAAVHFKAKARKAVVIAETKHEVEIDNAQVEDLCDQIFTELDAKLGMEEQHE